MNEKIQSMQRKTHDLRKQVMFVQSPEVIKIEVRGYLFIISIINDHSISSVSRQNERERRRKKKRYTYKSNIFTFICDYDCQRVDHYHLRDHHRRYVYRSKSIEHRVIK